MLVGWGNRRLAVDIAGPQSRRLANFVLADCQADAASSASVDAVALADEPDGRLRIVDPQGIVQSYTAFARAVDGLMAVLVEGLVRDVTDGPAFHAAATAYNGKAIVMPGVCGAGKSTLTAWLCGARGHAYLTDEAILLRADTLAVEFIRRPLHLKPGSAALAKQLGFARQGAPLVVEDHEHYFLSPTLFGSASMASYPLAAVVLPTYVDGAPLSLQRISGARAAALMLEVCLNAPKTGELAFSTAVAALADIPGFLLRYGDSTDLAWAFEKIESDLDV
jgi:hypothetical protein